MITARDLLPPDQVASAIWARWGVYGKNGRGKSHLWATFTGRLLVVIADRENAARYAERELNPALRGKTRVFVLRNWDQLAPLLRFCQEGCYQRDTEGKPFFDGIVFDTWTRIQAIEIAKLAGFKPPEPGQEAAFIDRSAEQPQGYAAWNKVGALAAQWMSYFNELPMHVLYTFQEAMHDEDRATAPVRGGPALTALAERATKDALGLFGRLYVDLVDADGQVTLDGANDRSYLQINPNATEVHRLLLGEHPVYFAKGPTDILGYTVENPTWEKLAQSLIGFRAVSQ